MSSHCHPTSNCLHLSPARPSGGCGGGGSGRESGGGRERVCRERKRRRGPGLSQSVLEVRALRGSLRTRSPSPPLSLSPFPTLYYSTTTTTTTKQAEQVLRCTYATRPHVGPNLLCHFFCFSLYSTNKNLTCIYLIN